MSAGFKFILPLHVINNGPIYINSHPSYLPLYKGKSAIKDAINNNEKYIGVTLHHMSKEVDSGKIIYQDKMSIDELTLNDVYNKIFSSLEPEVIFYRFLKLGYFLEDIKLNTGEAIEFDEN